MKQSWLIFFCCFLLSNGQTLLREETARNPYTYRYNVAVPETHNHYEVQEDGNENVVNGSYKVALPDGRTQIVTYEVHPIRGYEAKVEYEGEAVYPDSPNYYASAYGPPEPIRPSARNLKRQAPPHKPIKQNKAKRKLGKKHNIDVQKFDTDYSSDIPESNRVPRKIEYTILEEKVNKKKSTSHSKQALDETEDQKTSPSKIDYVKSKKSSENKKTKVKKEKEDIYDDTPEAPQAEPLSLQSSYQPKPRKTTKKPQPSVVTQEPKPSLVTKKYKPSKATEKPKPTVVPQNPKLTVVPHKAKPSTETQKPKPQIGVSFHQTPKPEHKKIEPKPISKTKVTNEAKQSNKPWSNCNDFETCFENVKLLLGKNVKEEKLGRPGVAVTRPPSFWPDSSDSIVDQVFAVPASLPLPPTTTAIYNISPQSIKPSNQVKRKINSKPVDNLDSVPLDSYLKPVFSNPPLANSKSQSSQKHENNLVSHTPKVSSSHDTTTPKITTLWRKDVAKFQPIIINSAEDKTVHQPLKAVPAIPTNSYEYTTIIPHQLPHRTKPRFLIKTISQPNKQNSQITPSRLSTGNVGPHLANAPVITPNTPINTGISKQEAPELYYGPNSPYVLYSGPPRYLRHTDVQPTPSIKVFNPYEYPTINSQNYHRPTIEETQLGSESQIHFYKPTVILPGLVRALPPKKPEVIQWKTKNPIVYKSLKNTEKASNNLKKSILSNTKLLRKLTLKSAKKEEATSKAIEKMRKIKATRYDETPFISNYPKRSSTIPTKKPQNTGYNTRGLSQRTPKVYTDDHDFEYETIHENSDDDSLDYYEDYNGFPFGARLPSFISPIPNSLSSTESEKVSNPQSGVEYAPVVRDSGVTYSPVHKGSTVRLIYSGDSYIPEYQSSHKN